MHILISGYYIVIGAGNTDDENVQAVIEQAGALAVDNLVALIGQ